MSSAFRPPLSRATLVLWTAWWRAVQLLRPACRRSTTFFWLALVLAAFCLRPDLAGVTSLVRGLGLTDGCYYCLLHFFHSTALPLEALTDAWLRTIRHLLGRRWVRQNGRPVLVVDGLKRSKEGRKRPGVKCLHQESDCNAKAPFIMGHSCQAVALLAQAAGVCLAIRRKFAAYERHIQIGLIAQGLLQYLALVFPRVAWRNFNSYIRTAKTDKAPSEWVVTCALRNTWPDFLRFSPKAITLKKFLASKVALQRASNRQIFQLDLAA